MRVAPGFCRAPGDVLRSEQGIALVTALVALALLSLLALYLSIAAANETRMADNFESHVQARYASLAGLNHARALLRGLDFDALLKGPDGDCSADPGYVAAARTFAFRNPLDWSLARFVDSAAPERDLAGTPDDGLVSTGAYAGTGGVPLIPGTGVPQLDAGGGSAAVRARYFVKVTDNNTDPSELARDPANDPFLDGDGTIVVRSMGIAPTVAELAGLAVRRNAVAVYEGRFRRSRAFALDAPLVVQGDDVRAVSEPMFQGLSFLITGESGSLGIAAIDVDATNAASPVALLRSAVSPAQAVRISGSGIPSIGDITSVTASDPEKSDLLKEPKAWGFLTTAHAFADNVYGADEDWGSGAIGSYDPSRPANDPIQKPQTTYVAGNLIISGTVTGAGLLIVKGRFSVTGSFRFSGLILVMGAGELDLRPADLEIHGAAYVARIEELPGALAWGTPALTVGGASRLYMDRQAIGMAVRLIPAEQCGFREITAAMDP